MDWKDTIAKVTDAAPLIGSLFGAPGAAIGGIVKLVASALGVAPSEDAVEAEIRRNPEALLKLREFEAAHRIELEKLLLETERIRLADIQSARTRQTEHERATGKTDTNLYILAWTLVIGFFVLLGILMNHPLPPDQNGVIFMLFGALSAGFGQVLQYFFGSSKGSADKTATMVAAMGGHK